MNIRTILKRIPHDDLLELALLLIQSNKKAQEKALRFLESKGYLDDKELTQKHYIEYREKFAKVIDIISEFNMYGGGPEDDEGRAYEKMEQVLSLLEDGKLPDECREEMIHDGTISRRKFRI
ncbi:hypothetical protein [Thermolongibacillus altinsuensis]|uniref:hypothetical protein n=1 Tax=Thermolongibacillus altinsuensis TaxID=575256 RepID=UPI00242A31EC|nr:hypothetical protein [Thermolongibacillus altinsuensis]GMB08069.1 hypothetical protein B1no1_07790 [Thermolongibacillus altinsuensis]